MKPIIFQEESVGAILKGQKTQTRRVIKPQPQSSERADVQWWSWKELNSVHCPWPECMRALSQYKQGDVLYVKENFAFDRKYDHLKPSEVQNTTVYYDDENIAKRKTRPSIFMPKKLSRVHLAITDVQVEQLQDISNDDIRAEGITPDGIWYIASSTPRHAFKMLWNSINSKKGYSWDTNPWVYIISFNLIWRINEQK